MHLLTRHPAVPRLLVGVMFAVLAMVVGATIAFAQASEPVSTGPLRPVDLPDVVEGETTTTVRGSGYAPGGQIDITIESDPVHLATVTADAAGSFEARVTIPAGLPAGAHTLKATGPDPAGGLRVLSTPVEVAGDPAGPLATTGTSLLWLVVVGAGAIGVGGVVSRRRVR